LSDTARDFGKQIVSNFDTYPCPSLAQIIAFSLRQENQIDHDDFCLAFELNTLFTVNVT
jgi:hypothetical protein